MAGFSGRSMPEHNRLGFQNSRAADFETLAGYAQALIDQKTQPSNLPSQPTAADPAAQAPSGLDLDEAIASPQELERWIESAPELKRALDDQPRLRDALIRSAQLAGE